MKTNLEEEMHYEFGKNWTRFLRVLNDKRIEIADQSLKDFLHKDELNGLKFLDVGCGSGLFSLSAKRLGATVYSFDYDILSVNCCKELKKRYLPPHHHPSSMSDSTKDEWIIEQGSVLDSEYMTQFRDYDIVYSWGVLHHTGNMELAFDNVAQAVKQGGLLFIAIYNDQGKKSVRWRKIKKLYSNSSKIVRFFIASLYIIRHWIPVILKDTVFKLNPFRSFINYKKNRGMSMLYDLYDWLGGYPFEVASCGAILDKFREKGFELIRLKDVNYSGCNEFLFIKK